MRYMAVIYVHVNSFIDLTINYHTHTNPFNLTPSGLLWVLGYFHVSRSGLST